MLDLSVNDILKLTFTVREQPILSPFGGAFVVADPSLLTIDQASWATDTMIYPTLYSGQSNKVVYFATKQARKDAKV